MRDAKPAEPDGQDLAEARRNPTVTEDEVTAPPAFSMQTLRDEVDRSLDQAAGNKEMLDKHFGNLSNEDEQVRAEAEGALHNLCNKVKAGAGPLAASQHLEKRIENLRELQKLLPVSPGAVSYDTLKLAKAEVGNRLPPDHRKALEELMKPMTPVKPRNIETKSAGRTPVAATKVILPGLQPLLQRNIEALNKWATTGSPDAIMARDRFMQVLKGAAAMGHVGRLLLPLEGAPDDVRRAQKDLRTRFVKPQEAQLKGVQDWLKAKISEIPENTRSKAYELHGRTVKADREKRKAGAASVPTMPDSRSIRNLKNIVDNGQRLWNRCKQLLDVVQGDNRLNAKYLHLSTQGFADLIPQTVHNPVSAFVRDTEKMGKSITAIAEDLPPIESMPVASATRPPTHDATLRRQLLNQLDMAVDSLDDDSGMLLAAQANLKNLPKPIHDAENVKRQRETGRKELVADFEAAQNNTLMLCTLRKIVRSNGSGMRDDLKAFKKDFLQAHGVPYPGPLPGHVQTTLDALIESTPRRGLGSWFAR